MTRSKRIKLGIIGLGVMGENHVRIASTLPGVQIIGAADTNHSRLEEVSKKYGLTCVANYQELLPRVDALIIASPTSTHFEIATNCLQAKKHLLVEKPFTASSKLAEELINLAKENQVKLFVNFIERFNPSFHKLLQVIKGERIHGLTLSRLSPYPERIIDTNVIFDMMIHDLDLLSQITSDKIITIKAKGKKVKSSQLDQVEVVMTHESGLITKIEASRIFGVKSRKISILTERCLWEADMLHKRLYRRDFTSAHPSTIPVQPKDQLTEVHAQFIKAINGKPCNLPEGQDAAWALNLAERIMSQCT